jgi:hypothetical protein
MLWESVVGIGGSVMRAERFSSVAANQSGIEIGLSRSPPGRSVPPHWGVIVQQLNNQSLRGSA